MKEVIFKNKVNQEFFFIQYLIERECVIVTYNWFAQQHFGEKKKSSSFKIRFFYSLLWDHFEIDHVYCVDNWSSFDATRKSFLIILPQTER